MNEKTFVRLGKQKKHFWEDQDDIVVASWYLKYNQHIKFITKNYLNFLCPSKFYQNWGDKFH